MINKFLRFAGRVFACGVMLTVSLHAESGTKFFSEFSGVWEYSGKTKLNGESYVVQFRYTIFQNQDRICGYVDHAGAPNKNYERYSFMGAAHKHYADLWLDAGTPSDADYSPHYPIDPTSIVRVKIVNGKLLMGHSMEERTGSLVFPNSEREIIYIEPIPLTQKSKVATLGDMYSIESYPTRAYIAKCLSDPVGKKQ